MHLFSFYKIIYDRGDIRTVTKLGRIYIVSYCDEITCDENSCVRFQVLGFAAKPSYSFLEDPHRKKKEKEA
jgi:hypothetical protein